jgi:trans-aconitate methyltransferase
MILFALYLETNFGKAVEAYQRFRVAYPEELFDAIHSRLPSGSYMRMLDIGAGTGLSITPHTPWFQEIHALEPDELMANALKLSTKGQNVMVVNETAEAVNFEKEWFHLITCATAFHWLDGDVMIPRIYDWLVPGGVFAEYSSPFIPDLESPWAPLIRSEFEEKWKPFSHANLSVHLRDNGYSREVLGRFGKFVNLRHDRFVKNLSWKAKDMLGILSSSSYFNAYLASLKNPQKYIQDLLHRLEQITGDELVPVQFQYGLVTANK